jgi:glutamyl-tRNA synthetase
MRQVPIAAKVDGVLPLLIRSGLVSEPVSNETRSLVTAVVTEAAHRLVVFGDILEYAYFFQADDQIGYDEKAMEKHIRKPPAPTWLPKLRDLVATAEPFDTATLKARVEDFAKAEGAKPGDVSQALRVAVTGRTTGFDAYATLAILGCERCLGRIGRTIDRSS